MNANYALAVSSGSAAVKIALSALDVGAGDEVIIPSFTFIATAEAVVEVGATPVVADINQTFNLDPADVIEKITSKTKAIIAVHMMGCAADILALKKIADDYSFIVLLADLFVPTKRTLLPFEHISSTFDAAALRCS